MGPGALWKSIFDKNDDLCPPFRCTWRTTESAVPGQVLPSAEHNPQDLKTPGAASCRDGIHLQFQSISTRLHQLYCFSFTFCIPIQHCSTIYPNTHSRVSYSSKPHLCMGLKMEYTPKVATPNGKKNDDSTKARGGPAW